MYNQKKKYQSPSTTVVAMIATASLLEGSPNGQNTSIITDKNTQTDNKDKLDVVNGSNKDIELESKSGQGWDDMTYWDSWD